MTDLTVHDVFIENENGEVIKFQLNAEDAKRATTDNAFALNLMHEYARQKNILQKPNETMLMKEVLSPTFYPSSESLSPANSIQEIGEDTNESDKAVFIWPSKSVYLLLQKYEERMNEFSSGVKRHSKIWESIANDMNTVDPNVAVTGTQCQSKLNSLKKMYRKVIDHNNISGNDRKSWQYFERMDELFGRSGWANPKAIASEAGPSSPASSTDENQNKRPTTKKLKSEKVLDEFIKQLKQDRQEREKKKEELKLTILQELKDQKEKQHKEKMDIMKKFCETIAGKKLFD